MNSINGHFEWEFESKDEGFYGDITDSLEAELLSIITTIQSGELNE